MEIVSIDSIAADQVASITDHTFLKTEDAFAKSELGAVRGRKAALNEFLNKTPLLEPYAVCVRHYDVAETRSILDSLGLQATQIAAVVGFPNANSYVQPGRFHEMVRNEIDDADDNGASEIDFVLPTDTFDWPTVESYVGGIHRAARASGLITKMIIEVSHNSPARIKEACELADKLGVNFVKTSTGYSNGGATVEALDIMRHNFGRGIKISGGVTPDNYKDLLRAASRTDDGLIKLDPQMIRIGASSLLPALYLKEDPQGNY